MFSEDLRIFWQKQPGGIGKLFYFPDIRVVAIFRLSQWCYRFHLKPLAYLLTNLNDFLHGVWIGPRVKAGAGLFLGHPRGIVINPETRIGQYVTIINQVTIGGAAVTIGDYVEIGAGAKIISKANKPIMIGDHAVIGAGAVVVHSVPAYAVVAGIPAKVIKYKQISEWWNEHPYYK